jgi:NADH dehydrogenase
MLQRDAIVGDSAHGLDAFGITPTPIASVAPAWLVRFRKSGRFTKPTTA